jgi:hypothetical protein
MFCSARYVKYVVCSFHDDLEFPATVITRTDVSYCALFAITLMLDLCTVSLRVSVMNYGSNDQI